jgi:hypothetical protein
MTTTPKRLGGSPPVEHRFKPGQSGNPGGRPKKQPTLRDTVVERLARLVPAIVDGKRQQVPLRDLIVDKALSKIADDPEDFVRLARWLDGDRPPAITDDISEVQPDDLDVIRRALDRRAEGGLAAEVDDE